MNAHRRFNNTPATQSTRTTDSSQSTAEALGQSDAPRHETQWLLDAVTRGTRVLIAAVDTDFRYTFFNEEHHNELRRLTGKETAIGMSLMEVLIDMPQERDKALALWGRALHGEAVAQTLIFGNPGRYCRWYSTRHTPIRNSAGMVVGAGAVTSDVTETIEAQTALHHSEERLRQAQEATGIEVWDLDTRSGVMECSARVKAWWGLSPDDAYTYERWLERVHPEDRDAAMAAVRHSKESNGSDRQAVEYRVVHPNGSERWVGVHAQTHSEDVADQRQVTRIVGTMQDITERKRVEAETRQYVDQLRAANDKLARFNRVAVGRELRMIELKKQVNELCIQVGRPPRYGLELGE